MALNSDNIFPDSNGSSTNGAYNGIKTTLDQDHQQDSDGVELKRLFFRLWNHRWKIVSSVIAFTVMAGTIALMVTPIFQSEGTLLITQQENQYADSDLASLLTNTYGIGMGSTIANELQILRSRKLSLEMADSVIHHRLMDNGRQYPVLFRSYPDDSTLAARDIVAHRIRQNIMFSHIEKEADVLSISYQSPSPLESADMVNLSMEVYTNLSQRQNRRSANSAVVFLEKERQRIEDELNSAENLLRVFMNEEKLVAVDAQTKELISRMAVLASRKQEAQVNLVAIESGVTQYEERLNNIKPGLADQYADAVGPNMSRLQFQLAELEIEKTQLLANNPSIVERQAASPKLQEINKKIEVYENRIREITSKLVAEGDQYLGFLGGSDGNISQAVTELNQKLIELQVERAQYAAQVEVIDGQLEEQRTFFDNLPDNMMDLARLKRDVKINEELFLTVSQQYAEMSLWRQTQFGLGRVIDSGIIPDTPVKPNKMLYLLVGFILGGIFSVSYVFVREVFNTTIDGVGKLEEFDYPLLSVIPDLNTFIEKEYRGSETTEVMDFELSTSLVTMLNTVSPISESFRRLQSNIIYSNPDQEFNSLMITSSMKGEGKSTIAANLGIALAEADYNTVIVDADLRRPRQHQLFDAKRAPGITELMFENIALEKVLQPTPLERLSLLSAGSDPLNPSAITQSRSFLKMMKELEERFDYVLIDTPPYGIITDASAMINQTDGVVVATRFNKTTEAELTHVLNNLDKVGAHVIGTVLTAFDHNQTSDYFYNSYYYQDVYENYSSYQHD